MADSPNQFDHMLTEERLYLDPHDKSTHTSTKYSSLLDSCACVLIFQNSFIPKPIQHETFFFYCCGNKQIMFKTDYYFGDA